MKINAKELYLNPEDRQRWRTIVERDGIVRNFVMQLKRPDGKVVWVRNTAQIGRNSNGEVLYYRILPNAGRRRSRSASSLRPSSKARCPSSSPMPWARLNLSMPNSRRPPAIPLPKPWGGPLESLNPVKHRPRSTDGFGRPSRRAAYGRGSSTIVRRTASYSGSRLPLPR